jgi:hypothetical protein
MIVTNSPYRVLVLAGNTTEHSNGSPLSTLLADSDTAGHQLIGFYDYDSGLAFDSANIPTNLERFVVAASYKLDGSATFNKTLMQRTPNIRPEDIISITKTTHQDGQNQIFDVAVHGEYLRCSEDFGIRIVFDNARLRNILGKKFDRSYVVVPECNDENCNCPEVKCVETTFNLASVIRQDSDAPIANVEVGYYATAGDPSTFTVISSAGAWDTNTMGDCPIIRITVDELVVRRGYCNPNIENYVFMGTVAAAYPIPGISFPNAIDVTYVQDMVFEFNTYYQAKRLLDNQAANLDNIYKDSPFWRNVAVEPTLTQGVNYNIYALVYDNKVEDYSSPYTNKMNGLLYIVVPESNNALVTEIEAVFSAIADEYNIGIVNF